MDTAFSDCIKDGSFIDPACGTAGFLISAYRYILEHNKDEEGRIVLTPDEKTRLMQNFEGYDISQDMVRLSSVNMYLHHFPDPKIHEYDTLTAQDRWDDQFDAIFANPPFMTPKGGIIPHNRFRVQAKRSEILFVDYIAEHLAPNGRAGIIVPEGIVFQSANAYKELRKYLVDEGLLYAVISLPAGVFNPYSGVKTSVLLFDKAFAKLRNDILFVKLSNDGFDLGAQRRPVKGSEISDIVNLINAFKDNKDVSDNSLVTIVKKETIASQDYILVGERLKEAVVTNSKWPLVKLGEICEIERGASPRPIKEYITDADDGENWIKIGDGTEASIYIYTAKEKITKEGADKSRRVYKGDLILSNSMSFGKPYILCIDGCVHDGWLIIRNVKGLFNPLYLCYILGSNMIMQEYKRLATGGVVNNLNSNLVRNCKIPLPPLSVQDEIVAEIGSYQKLIDEANRNIEKLKHKKTDAIDQIWYSDRLESSIVPFHDVEDTLQYARNSSDKLIEAVQKHQDGDSHE